MDHDVVVVVMNYRLGPYGFLNLEMGSRVQGNMGLKDQNLALKWVQKNIAAFGGDKNRVLLFGESAGAAAAHLHILSPMSKGLFHRAILQSGSALAPWGFSRYPGDTAKEYANKIGCSNATLEDLVNCYKDTKWEKLVSQQFTLLKPLILPDMFQPSVDGQFLKKRPVDILNEGDFPSIPVMFGVTSGEGGIRSGRFDANPDWIQELDADWEALLRNVMILDAPVSSEIAKKIRAKYFGTNRFAEDQNEFLANLTLMMSDSGFFDPVHQSALYHAKNQAPVYLYYYNYTSKGYPGVYSVYSAVSFKEWLPLGIKMIWKEISDWFKEFVLQTSSTRAYGISHGEDTFQQWNVYGFTKYFASPDEEFSKVFVKNIIDFANGSEPLKFRNLEWPQAYKPYTQIDKSSTPLYMLMDNSETPRVIPEPNAIRINFWKQLAGWDTLRY